MQTIVADSKYIFTKSGSLVRALQPVNGELWSVERVDTGKAMLVPASALTLAR